MLLQCLKTEPLLGFVVVLRATYCIIQGPSYGPTVLRTVVVDLSPEPEQYLPAPTRSTHPSTYFLHPPTGHAPCCCICMWVQLLLRS